MTTVLQSNNNFVSTSLNTPTKNISISVSAVEGSPKQFKKPTRDIKNLADIQTINATRFNGSPLSVALQKGSVNDRHIRTMPEVSHGSSLQVPKKQSHDSMSTSSISSFDSDKSKSPKSSSFNGNFERTSATSQGRIAFRILQTKFGGDVKLDGKNKPYFKFVMGLSCQKSKGNLIEEGNLVLEEEVKIKSGSHEFAKIKIKGKGKLLDNTIAKAKVSVKDIKENGQKIQWVNLYKGDNVVGQMQLDMEFFSN